MWLLRAQLPVGAWPGRYAGGDLLATCAALRALLAAGVLRGKTPVTRATDWLIGQQNSDGGWHAGDVRSPRLVGRSDEAGTSCALTALLAVGGTEAGDAAEAAAGWLIRAQRADGSWPRALATGASALRWRSDPQRHAVAAGVPLPLAALGQYRAAQDARN